jgi:multicomponent K+:H+ antiporter subunit D
MPQLIVAPVLLPLATAALLLFLAERRRALKAFINLASCVLGLALAVALLLWVDGRDTPGSFAVYLPGNWPVPFGIVLVLDRLSALMLVLAAALGLASLLFSLAR